MGGTGHAGGVSFQAAYDAAMRDNLPEKATDILMNEAATEFAGGMTAAAHSTLHRVQPAARPDSPFRLFFCWPRWATTPLAERALAEHIHGPGTDTLMTYIYGPRIRAAIALHQAKPLEAIAELGNPPSSTISPPASER